MKILVTGASGFLGRNLIDYLIIHDYSVIAVDLQEYNPFTHNKVEYCKINDLDDVHAIIKSVYNIDAIIHLAAIVHQKKKLSDDLYYSINTEKTIDLALVAKSSFIKQFIFMSTLSVYGKNASRFPLTEDSLVNPVNGYGKSKYSAEQKLQELQNNNFKVAIIRAPLIYGAGVKGNMLSLIKLVDKLFMLPLGNINNYRTMVSIHNLTRLINTIVINKASGVFLAGDGKSISTTQVIDTIKDFLGKKRILVPIPNIIQKILFLIVPPIAEKVFGTLELDTSKTNEILNFKPVDDFKETIEEMVKWYKDQD